MPADKLTREQWVERYGGQALLDREGFDVVPCFSCNDPICHGWRVQRKERCKHDRLDMDGICFRCGADCRGIHG